MNRFSFKIAVFVLALLLAGGGISTHAREKQKKNKRGYDLSANPLGNVKTSQPDKVLYDKAMKAMKKSRYDVARLDLQTLLNTYPDSEYRMRAKLSVGDTWFKEGGSAALTQAEAEYKDFITFFPAAPEAAEAQMKVADIYYEQMEKPDRDYTNAQRAEEEYRNMLNQFPDSTLIPRARQKLRDVQEVLAEREFQVGNYYEEKEDFSAAIARLQTVSDTYPLYSKSDQVLLGIGDSFAGQANAIQLNTAMPNAVKERLHAVYQDRAATAYGKVITRYPMAPHVEDARDRLVAMNRSIPEPSQAAVSESDAEERSRQPLRFTDRTLGLIKHGPIVIEAVHVGDPSIQDPPRTLAPDINKQNVQIFKDAVNAGKPPEAAEAAKPTTVNEPPRSDRPSDAPVQMTPIAGGTGLGVSIVSAPNGTAGEGAPTAGTTSAVPGVNAVGPANTTLPEAEKPGSPPEQVNDITKTPTQTAPSEAKKKPKADLSDESSSKKKKKKGLGKINPF